MEEEYQQISEGQRKAMMAEQIATQGAVGGYQSPASESAEHVREFSEDFTLSFDGETGEIIGGSIPKSTKTMYWGINNKNFVWGCYNRNDLRVIATKKQEIDIIDRMYKVNKKVMSKLPQENSRIEQFKQMCINQVNQDIHTFAKGTRALDGKERRHMVSSYSYAAVDSPDPQKRAGGIRGAIGNLFNR